MQSSAMKGSASLKIDLTQTAYCPDRGTLYSNYIEQFMKRIFLFLSVLFLAFTLSAQIKTHIAKKHESYESLAVFYLMSEKEIREANKDIPEVYEGARIIIPEKKAKPARSSQQSSQSSLQSSMDRLSSTLDQILAEQNSDYNKNFKNGNAEFYRKNYKSAASFYEKALKYRDSEEAHYNASVAYFNCGKYKKAIAHAQKARYSSDSSIASGAKSVIEDSNNILYRRSQNAALIVGQILSTASGVTNNTFTPQPTNYTGGYPTQNNSNTSPSSYSSGSSNVSRSSSSSASSSTRRCPYCKGSGWYECACSHAASFGLEQGSHVCPNCGKNHKKGSHSCKCTKCGGTGRL